MKALYLVDRAKQLNFLNCHIISLRTKRHTFLALLWLRGKKTIQYSVNLLKICDKFLKAIEMFVKYIYIQINRDALR